jgi:hypothetical protein
MLLMHSCASNYQQLCLKPLMKVLSLLIWDVLLHPQVATWVTVTSWEFRWHLSEIPEGRVRSCPASSTAK